MNQLQTMAPNGTIGTRHLLFTLRRFDVSAFRRFTHAVRRSF
jgi:hypothetical protein